MSSTYDVELYIYDLSQGMAKTLGPLLLRKNIEGIWHTGVVVYGREYFFGSNGIQFVDPGGTILGHTYKTMKMGKTEVPLEIFEEYLRGLASDEFRDDKYHLMEHNCNTFSNSVVAFLLHKHIPNYIINLPKEIQDTPIGALLKPVLENVYRGQRMFGGQGISLQKSTDESSNGSTVLSKDSEANVKKNNKDNKINKNRNNDKSSEFANDLTNNEDEDIISGGCNNGDKEVEERRLKIERVLKETLKKFSDEKIGASSS